MAMARGKSIEPGPTGYFRNLGRFECPDIHYALLLEAGYVFTSIPAPSAYASLFMFQFIPFAQTVGVLSRFELNSPEDDSSEHRNRVCR